MISLRECQKSVVSEWILGSRMDDLELFEPSDFDELREPVQALKAGRRGYVQIAEACPNWSVVQLADITSHTISYVYDSSLEVCLNEKATRLMADVNRNNVVERIQQGYELINSRHSIITSTKLTDAFKLELDRRHSKRTMPYPFRRLTEYTGGIHSKELTTIAARPGVGKTALAFQIASYSAVQGHRVIYLPLEMSVAEMAVRGFLGKSTASYLSLMHGDIDPESDEYKSGEKYLASLEKHMEMYEGLCDMDEIELCVRQNRPELIVIDQLSQLRGGSFNSIRERYTDYTRRLKSLAMKHDTAVILCAQLNRIAENEKPTLGQLKESGSIEEDSDNVLLLWRPVGQNEQKKTTKKEVDVGLEIAKQ